jgi:HPt (histidine-containing phosphotransfer) domain-containing protein
VAKYVQLRDDVPSAVDEAIFEALLDQLGEPDAEFRRELIDSYLNEGVGYAEAAVAAASAQDAATFGRAAHALRSSSALMGATRLADMLLQAEAVARVTPSGLPELAGPISAEYDRVAASLVLLSPGLSTDL